MDDDAGFDAMKDSVNAFVGKEIDVGEYGKAILKNERAFNKRAGFTAKDDRLPEFFYTEPLPPHDVVFNVPDDEIDKVYEEM